MTPEQIIEAIRLLPVQQRGRIVGNVVSDILDDMRMNHGNAQWEGDPVFVAFARQPLSTSMRLAFERWMETEVSQEQQIHVEPTDRDKPPVPRPPRRMP